MLAHFCAFFPLTLSLEHFVSDLSSTMLASLLLILVPLTSSMPTGEVMFLDDERVIRIGDMLFSEDQLDNFYGEQAERSGIAGEQYRWPKGEIPYSVKGNLRKLYNYCIHINYPY